MQQSLHALNNLSTKWVWVYIRVTKKNMGLLEEWAPPASSNLSHLCVGVSHTWATNKVTFLQVYLIQECNCAGMSVWCAPCASTLPDPTTNTRGTNTGVTPLKTASIFSLIDPDFFISMSSVHRPCILHYFNKRFDEFRCHSFLCMLKRYFVTMLWYLWYAMGILSEVV